MGRSDDDHYRETLSKPAHDRTKRTNSTTATLNHPGMTQSGSAIAPTGTGVISGRSSLAGAGCRAFRNTASATHDTMLTPSHCGAPGGRPCSTTAAELNPLLITLDTTRKLIFSPSDLLELPNPDSRTCQFLRQIVPFGIRASSNLYGIEGFHLKDVLGTAAVAIAGCVSSEPHFVDVETRGDLTRGMTVIDSRPGTTAAPNARVATGVAVSEVRAYIERTLKAAH